MCWRDTSVSTTGTTWQTSTIEVSLSGGQLIAKIIGAAAVDGGEMRPLVPLSQTQFEGLGIGYRFIVDDKGNDFFTGPAGGQSTGPLLTIGRR